MNALISNVNYFFDNRAPSFDKFTFMDYFKKPSPDRVGQFLKEKIGDSASNYIYYMGAPLCYNSSIHCYVQRSYAFLDAALMIQENDSNFFQIFTLNNLAGKNIDSLLYTLSWMVGYQVYAEIVITGKEVISDLTKDSNKGPEFYEIFILSTLYKLSYLLLMFFPCGRLALLLPKINFLCRFMVICLALHKLVIDKNRIEFICATSIISWLEMSRWVASLRK